jgi:hypothetical protein
MEGIMSCESTYDAKLYVRNYQVKIQAGPSAASREQIVHTCFIIPGKHVSLCWRREMAKLLLHLQSMMIKTV